jgi:hypothetical protein
MAVERPHGGETREEEALSSPPPHTTANRGAATTTVVALQETIFKRTLTTNSERSTRTTTLERSGAGGRQQRAERKHLARTLAGARRDDDGHTGPTPVHSLQAVATREKLCLFANEESERQIGVVVALARGSYQRTMFKFVGTRRRVKKKKQKCCWDVFTKGNEIKKSERTKAGNAGGY